MLLLSTPALLIGVASSLVLIAVMKVASVLQQFLWERLPISIGIAQDSPFWIITMLTLTGVMVGLIIRYSHGHAGPDPACEPLIGMPVSTSALPGLLAALIIGLAGGVSLGPEHPIMTVNIALAVAIGSRMFPRIAKLDWTILASAGTIGALFGTPVAAALVFSQTLNSSNDVPLWDRLFAPLMAAAAGSLTTSLFFHPHFSLPIAHYTQMHLVDIFRRGRCCHCYRGGDGGRVVPASFAPSDTSPEIPGADPRRWRLYPRYSGCYRRTTNPV